LVPETGYSWYFTAKLARYPISGMDIDEMIKTISQAGYLVKKGLKEGCG